MRTHYIYLNIYHNGYLYIGSHTWEGSGQDPSYEGSSAIAKRYNWHPIKQVVLEYVSPERKFVAEREWIQKYLEVYGLSRAVGGLIKTPLRDRYKGNGLMLNAHTNSAECAILNHARSVETQIRSGAFKKFMQAGHIHNSSKENIQRLVDGTTPEVRRRQAESRNYHEIAKKLSISKKGKHATQRRVKVTFDGKEIEGSVRQVCLKLGNPNWGVRVSKLFSQGATEVECHGHKITLV